MRNFIKIIVYSFLFSSIVSCGGFKKVDTRETPISGPERAKKNVREGRGVGLGQAINKARGSTNYEFSTSNPMWRATLDILDFLPLSTVDYSGGVIISDWYTDNSTTNEAIKITIRFLSNEIGVGSLDVKIFKKICDSLNSCRTVEEKGSLVAEVKKSILKRAAIYEKEKKDKNFKKYKMSTPGKSD